MVLYTYISISDVGVQILKNRFLPHDPYEASCVVCVVINDMKKSRHVTLTVLVDCIH